MKSTQALLGARIKELRKLRKMSQERLSELIGIEPKHMSRIEVGKSYPTLDRLERISNALNIPMKEFFDFEHLKGDVEKMEDIDEMLKQVDREDMRVVYKIVKAFVEK